MTRLTKWFIRKLLMSSIGTFFLKVLEVKFIITVRGKVVVEHPMHEVIKTMMK